MKVLLQPGANVIKLFRALSCEFLQYTRAFVPGKPFQPSLMFVGKAGAYLSGAPFQWTTLGYAPGLTRKHYVIKWVYMNESSWLLRIDFQETQTLHQN